MAHHGSVAQQTATPLPRVHRPPAAPAAPAAAAARSEPEVVTLASPRPDGDRTVNEYVETPFRSSEAAGAGAGAESHHQALHLPVGKERGVVRKQPGAATTFKKERAGAGAAAGSRGAECYSGSIICPDCGRCRCEACRQPRPLPSRWLCDNACFCSAEAAVDHASCVCCVKALFYHCSKDYELERDGDGTSCADSPCSCAPHRRWARWGCLAALSAALPCLWCYWPLRGCLHVCERCYARFGSQGCRCAPPARQDLTPEKRLLDSSSDF
ncbi:protein sprouty [Bacillus rossius redtenbacheri]|uniref:protein sprouty n=1 Tax=Bacillus rossius redtenbacheri TaxID=93214 RepID=UPI002FDD288E